MLVPALENFDLIARGVGSRPLARRLREIHAALRDQSLQVALRLIDRTWRAPPPAAARGSRRGCRAARACPDRHT
jgi:hypothetical protein